MSRILSFSLFQWDDRFPELEDVDMYLIGFFIAFAVFYIVEVCVNIQ